jgi:opacity protein-like surface antigen
MKNVILTVVMVLLLGVAASAQQATVGVTGKGLKLGFGIANINTDYNELDEFLDSRMGFSGGAFLTYSLSRQIAVQPEILYVTKGAAKDIFFFNAHLNLDYLEIPVLLKFDFVPDGKLRPNLYAGPALDVLLASKFHIIDETYDIKDYTKGMDFSLVFGGGFDYNRVTFDIRYTLGLTGIVDAADKINEAIGSEPGDSYYLEGDPSVKNTNLSFMLGFKL